MRKGAIAVLMAAIVAVLAGMHWGRPGARAIQPEPSVRPVLDKYGGSPQLRCTNKTKHFILAKIGNHWFFCDPLGNGLISMSVGNAGPNGNPTPDCNGANTYPIYAAKYGTVGDSSGTGPNWGWQTLKRMASWGFNSVGQDSVGSVMPWQTCSGCIWPGGQQPIPMPYITEMRPGQYAAGNRFGYLPEPIKDEINGTNNNFQAWRGGADFDVFDPKLNTEFQDELSKINQPDVQNIQNNYPYLLGVFTDDSDWFSGSGAGPDFVTGHTTGNIGFVTLITSPVHTFAQNPPYAPQNAILYQDTKVYSKALATNPAPCSISSPCSLRDYLWQKYNGSIANLNAAWGSNYTTFDSTGTQVTGETIGTGNGSTLAFTHTLAHTSISPFSVLISVGGTAQIGDCPWFLGGCGTANTGTLGSPTANLVTQASSTINYSTGAVTITFASAPTSGTTITVSYIYGGWMAGGTGLMDEDGSHSWVGTNPWCLEGADPNYSTYFACVGGGGNNEPVPNANPALGADLDNWVSQWAAEYFKTMHDDLKTHSQLPYLGLDTIGAWGGPAYSKFLEGAAPYVDGVFTSLFQQGLSPSPAAFQSAYQYTTQYLGDVPLLDFFTLLAEPDSSMSCNVTTPFENFSTQSARGQEYYNTVSYMLSTPGHNGTIPFVGFDWWSWQDFQGANQDLVSIHDNAYDGVEAVSGKVPCQSYYSVLSGATCGGESANYGDVITPVKKANALWYNLLPSSASERDTRQPPESATPSKRNSKKPGENP